MKLVTFFSVLLALFSTSAFSYDHNKCMRKTRNWAAPFNAFLSSSSFFTSTGDCAMIGSIPERKQQFIAFNYAPLQKDSARGEGEYLSTYANLSGCSKDETKKLASSLQKNITEVFGPELNNSPEQAYNQIELLISDDPELSISCKPKA